MSIIMAAKKNMRQPCPSEQQRTLFPSNYDCFCVQRPGQLVHDQLHFVAEATGTGRSHHRVHHSSAQRPAVRNVRQTVRGGRWRLHLSGPHRSCRAVPGRFGAAVPELPQSGRFPCVLKCVGLICMVYSRYSSSYHSCVPVLEVAVGDYDVDLSRLVNAAEKIYCAERAATYLHDDTILRCDSRAPIGEHNYSIEQLYSVAYSIFSHDFFLGV